MSKTKKPSLPGGYQPPPDDIFLVALFASDLKTLSELTRRTPMDSGPQMVDPANKGVEAHFFITEKQIAQLKKEGWRLEVRENLSEVGRQRQKEVGKGDRFKSGTIPPKGLGKKL